MRGVVLVKRVAGFVLGWLAIMFLMWLVGCLWSWLGIGW